jgi:hypothetical protein
MLADPEVRRLIFIGRMEAGGGVAGGAATPAADACPGSFGTSCSPSSGDYTFANGNVGIGLSSAAAGIVDCQNGQKKVKFGQAQLSRISPEHGSKTVDTGLSSVDLFMAFLIWGTNPNEYLCRGNPDGGEVTVFSSDNQSESYFDWIAIGE